MSCSLRLSAGFLRLTGGYPALLVGLSLVISQLCVSQRIDAQELRLLFLGDNNAHRPEQRFQDLASALQPRGIKLQYTDRMSDLTADTLEKFHGLILYANIDRIEDQQAQAVLNFVAGGKGFIPLHCATYCWRNNRDMVALMGAQFQRHGAQVFATQVADASHPIMQGFGGFVSWDETYIHHLHNEENRTVLEYRVEGEQAEGRSREPWTWIRTHGKGRMFYTAWGHDHRTFTHPGFHNLAERGIRWACGFDPAVVPPYTDPQKFPVPAMTQLRTDVAPFEYLDVGPKIPNYTPGTRWGVQGAPRTMMQLPLSPEESARHLVTPEGMTAKLWADEGSFQAKPLAMNWDDRGRLWICETLDYPNELGTRRDRIRICEDTDGDGRADRFTIFAENLSIPAAIMICCGGAVVQDGTETVYLKDTDGDDRADVRTTLISGWALGDTHGGVSNFRYGLDNWIWAMQGYNNSTPEYNGKTSQSFRMGFWRFKLSNADPPVVTDLEFVRSTNNNTWGLGISEEGLIFGSTANHNPSTFMPIPNRYYERVRGWAPTEIGTIADSHLFAAITDKVRQVDQFGGYTAGAGHALYTARTFPPEWWNRTAFVCEPTGHLVGTFVLRPAGTAFTSTSPLNLLASDDEWCAPIAAEVGPDGAVWVLDWYNYIVQHNPTPQGFENGRGNAYESDLRDKKHGRIYRVVPIENEQEIVHSWQSLATADSGQLVAALKHPSMVWRLQAQRRLVERQESAAVPELLAILQDESVDQTGLNVGVIHAVWTLAGIAEHDPALHPQMLAPLVDLLDHPSAGVRRNALAVLITIPNSGEHILQRRCLIDDSHPQVRLQGILAVADLKPGPEAGGLAAELAVRPNLDQWELDAVTCAAAAQADDFLTAFGQARAASAQAAAIIRTVAEHVSRGRPDGAKIESLVRSISTSDPVVIDAVISGLAEGWPEDHRPQSTSQLDQNLVQLMQRIPAASRGRLLQVAARSGSKALQSYADEITAGFLKVLADESADVSSRSEAAREAIRFQPQNIQVLADVLEQLTSQAPADFAAGLLDAASLNTTPELGGLLLERLPGLTPTTRTSAIRVLLSRPATTRSLLDALATGKLDLQDLSLDQKQALRSHPDPEIRKRSEQIMASGGGLPDANRDKVLQQLLPVCEQEGDSGAGKLMFVKHCSKCHMHGTEGKTLGPNLTGMAVHPKHELLTHIIDPSRSVEGNFRLYTVVKTSGLVISGMMTSESRTSLTLVDTDAKEHIVPREDIDELISSRKSLMPEGFEKQMTPEELGNLLQFLTDKGKYMPITLDRYATAVSTKGLFHDGDNGPDRMIFADWTPKMLDGIPFVLTDPRGKSAPNIILLNGPQGSLPPKMPRSVTLPCNSAALRIHLLSGVGGWSYPAIREQSVSMIVRLHYEDGSTEDHELRNGVHFADYIRRVDVPGSQFAFALGGQQVRTLSVVPAQKQLIRQIELVKGADATAPIVMAVTVERP